MLLSRYEYEGRQHSPHGRYSGFQFLNGHASTISSQLLANHASRQAKASRLEEWARLPLASEAQRMEWIAKKRTDFETLASAKPWSGAQDSLQEEQSQFPPSAAVNAARPPRVSGSGSPADATVEPSPPHHSQTPSQERVQRVGQHQSSATPTTEGTDRARQLSSTHWRRFF
jgi:hypothetical protein